MMVYIGVSGGYYILFYTGIMLYIPIRLYLYLPSTYYRYLGTPPPRIEFWAVLLNVIAGPYRTSKTIQPI